jgi:beta-mannosidase
MLEETVVLNTLRIRNNPSLVLYCSGNESPNPFGDAIDMMGRCAEELDGTRGFHRGEPWGGAKHNYDTYWGRAHLDASVGLTADFIGEFGIACLPVLESVNRYLPENEKNKWPAEPGSGFEYHTPIFGTGEDLSRLCQTAGYFTELECSLEQLVTASQLAQAVGVRHTLERARTRWPDAAGALYYKLNDNYPAMSWSTVDWYGAPKLGHFVIKQSFEPIGAYVLPQSVAFAGTPSRMPVWLCDDLGALEGKETAVRATAYDGALNELAKRLYVWRSHGEPTHKLGEFSLEYEMTTNPPLFIYVELLADGKKLFDTFYLFNFEYAKKQLFNLPATDLSLAASSTGDGLHSAVVANTGHMPAVGCRVERPGHADTFTAWDNFFWLQPGEKRHIRVSSICGLAAKALNVR